MRVIFTLFLIGICVTGFAQRYARTSGDWTDPIWASTPTGTAGSAATPTATDDVYTNGFVVTVDGNRSCHNLFLEFNVIEGLSFSNPLATLNISGSFNVWDSGSEFYEYPTVDVVENQGRIRFTGADVNLEPPYVILLWDASVADFCTLQFDFGEGNAYNIFETVNVGLGSPQSRQFNVLSGTLIADPGAEIRGVSNTTLSVSGDASLICQSPINGGSSSLSIGSVDLRGTIITSSYINASQFAINNSGTLETSFNGADQTEGWWFQSNRPISGNLNPNSTVHFAAFGNQNVFARTYGNLTLDGSGTKSVPNAAALAISGSLSITSTSVTFSAVNATGVTISGDLDNDGNWSPVQLITFNGSADASVGGSQSTNFGGGLRVNKTSGITLTIGTATTIGNGITISSGNLNLGNVLTTLSSGNVTASLGTILISGPSGALLIESTSQFSGAGSYTLNHATVGASGAATFNTNIAFTGNLTNSGSLTFPTSVDVTFNGSTTQTISGNAFSIYDMIVNKTSSTLSNNAPVTLQGNLTMTTGTFDADGSTGQFILDSDSNGDASIGPMAGGSVTGNVTFRRYYDNTIINRYRNFAFPVTGVTVANVGSFITILNGSFARYNESTPGNFDQGWVVLNSGTLSSSTGYTAGMYSDVPVTLSFTGPLFKNLPSLHNFNLTYTDDPAQPASQDGWNFVPNPYACPINWNAGSGWTKGLGVVAGAAVWDNVANTYRYSNVNWDGVVAQGQAFWVQTFSSATDLQSTEAVKVINPDPTFYRKRQEAIQNNRLLVKLENDKYHDVALVQYNDSSTPEFDGAFDAFKLKNPIFNLSTLTPGGENMAANVMPKSFCTSNIKVNINNIEPGNYRLVFDSLSTFTGLSTALLVDHFTNQELELSEGLIYSFEITPDLNSWGTERFELRFVFNDTEAFEPTVSLDNRKLVSNFETGNQWIFNGQLLENENGRILLPTMEGEYQVLVSDGKCSIKSPIFTLDKIPHRIHPNPASESFEIDLTGILEESGAKSGYIYLYALNGQLVHKEKFSKNEMDKSIQVSNLKSGEYVVNVTEGESKIVAKERLQIIK